MGCRRKMKGSPRRKFAAVVGAFPFLCLTAPLNGCAVGPDFVPPEVRTQDNWIESRDFRVVSNAGVRSHWWEAFGDRTLDRLVELAYEQNLPVQIAGLRILEARAELGVAIGNLYPQTQEGSGNAQQNLLSSRLANQANLQHAFANFNLGFDAAWELDFWGRFRRNVEAADAKLLATTADYDNALVSLTAETARAYATIRTYEVLIQIARENARVQREGLEIAQSRFRNGATSELDVAQARTLLESTLADIPEFQASLRQAKNALTTLLGRPPGEIEALLQGPQRIPKAPAKVAIGLPAELLRRRPDIRAAEFGASAEAARIGVAEADLYPRFFLLGEIGVQSSDAAKLFAPHSLFFTAGPGFKWSILNYGRITNNVRAQDARFQEALVNYENTVIKAAQEVEDALIAFLKDQESAVNLQKSVASARRAVEIAIIRYREGAEDYQRVVDSQRFLLQEENRLAQTRSAIATHLIALYKALGGGWELREGRPVVPEAMQAEMAARTNWGDLLPAQSPPTTDELPLPTPASVAPPLLPPDW
jgi:NodT family efflux transporter outer membrane factor (OMF) lipoprotein